MAIQRKYRLNLRNYGNLPAIMLSQYDEGYDLVFEIYDGPDAAENLSAYTVKLCGTRRDTLKYELTGTIANNVLSFPVDTTMSACDGKGVAEIEIIKTADDTKFATFNLPVFVEKAAVPNDAVDADVERAQEIAEQVEELIDGATYGAEAWATGQKNGVDVETTDPTYHNNAKYYAEQAQDIADSIGIDETLSITGKAADAKKTGDEIASLKEELSDDVNGLESDLYTVSDNLFDFDNIITNKIPGTTGTAPDVMVDINGWYTSNYIPVESGEQYALILNGTITQGAIFRVACYANGVMTYKTEGSTETNPYTIPEGVDHIRFFSNTASLFASRTATSFKKYSASMSLAWSPFGKSANYVKKSDVKEYGVVVSGSDYYHFVRFGEKTLIRKFKQEGPNNLFQFSALYVGDVSKYGVTIDETIATNGTDTVGPISIMRQGVDSGGLWSGGWHTKTVDNVACPTAEQYSLDVKVNGVSVVGHDGLYYGECIAEVVNKLYFPQTITGSDLSTATQAIEEHVSYILNDKMTARVSHKYVADTRVILYYGMQAVRIGFDSVLLPNNETEIVFDDMTGNINLDSAESLMAVKNSYWNYDLTLKDIGLAQLKHNSGAGATKYGYIPQNTRKLYWALIEGTYDYSFITAGKILTWEGEYNIYPR